MEDLEAGKIQDPYSELARRTGLTRQQAKEALYAALYSYDSGPTDYVIRGTVTGRIRPEEHSQLPYIFERPRSYPLSSYAPGIRMTHCDDPASEIRCAVCGKPVDRASMHRDEARDVEVWTVECHGDTETTYLTAMDRVEAGPGGVKPGIAFRKKRIEK